MGFLITLWRNKSLIALAGMGIAVAVLFALLQMEKAGSAGKDADINRLAGVISGLNSQVATLRTAVEDRDRQIAENRKVIAAGDNVTRDLAETKDRIAADADALRKELRNAKSDVAVVELLAGGLCGVEQRLAALRARHLNRNDARADQASAGIVDAACTGPVDASVRATADYAMRFAITLEQAAEQIFATGTVIREINAIIEPKPGAP